MGSAHAKDVYGGRHPSTIPAYTIADAARMLSLPPATVRAWVRGQTVVSRGRRRTFLRVIEADDPRFISTVKAMERELLREKHVMRYAAADDFGLPATAFLICRFWLVDAWWSLGRRAEARDLFVDALAHRNRYGLLSEDIDPQTGALWGNFPQTYSMAGLILSAMRLSRSWEDRYWRG